MQSLHPCSGRLAQVALIALAACGGPDSPADINAGTPVVAEDAGALTLSRVDTVLRNLEVPWGVVELPSGGLFVAERPGRIRYRAPGSETADVWATVDVYAEDPGIGPEAGLMGIALDPDTSGGPALYALATTWRSPGDRDRTIAARLWRRVAGFFTPIGALKYKNQVLRLSRDTAGTVRTEVVVDDLATSYYHAGGSIAVGPDGHLYVGVGDAILPQLARDPRTPVGKLLRFTRDGGIPDDNPEPGSPVFARGLRNTQSIAWLPDGTLLGVDHGPSGMDQEQGRQGRDELNILRAGGDYGWPEVTGWDVAEGVESPMWMWEQPIAPAGLAIRPGSSPDSARVLVGGLRGHVEQLTLVRTGGEWRVTRRAQLPHGVFGRVRTLVVSRDGSVLLTTSNRDARGVPRPGDDLVVRLTLAP
jgi:glucose/arabinose dehydrogenase